MKLLPLGTVMKVNNHKVCIIGYSSVEKESTKAGYLVVSYPVGFTHIDKVFFIPQDLECTVLAEGYKTGASEKVLDTISKSLEAVKDVPTEELLKFRDIYKKASSGKEGAEK